MWRHELHRVVLCSLHVVGGSFVRTLPELLAELGNQHPQLSEALSWLGWLIDQWRALPEGTGVLLGFAVLWFMLRRERKRLSERIETLRQIITATGDQSEEQEVALAQEQTSSATPPRPAPNGGTEELAPIRDDLANWLTVRAVWRDIRDRLEILIEDISSSRVRGKYSKMPRRRYRDIINALEKDRELTAKIANTLLAMEGTFNRARFKPRGVGDGDVVAMVDAYNLVSRFLPPSPDGAPQVDVPSATPAQQRDIVAPRAA
jgi:hypothetical protein